MATEAQKAAIDKARKRKEEIDGWKEKAEKYDKIAAAFKDEGFSFNRRQRNLVTVRNTWPELLTALKEQIGLNDNDSSLL
jgi:hypothetical protein